MEQERTGAGGLLAAAGLAVTVGVIHVEDQGGLSVLQDPAWIGWGYRVLEVGALLTAALLLTRRLPRLAWTASLLVGLGPLLGYVFSRTTGLPGSSDDVGHWGEPLGVVSLVVEGALILVAALQLLADVSPSVDAVARPVRTPVGAGR